MRPDAQTMISHPRQLAARLFPRPWRPALVLALLLTACSAAFAQRIALTFDDGLDPRKQPQAAEWNAALLNALDAAKVQAMLFPAGRVVDSPQGLALVRQWAEQGHLIGNHTYAHRNFASPRVSLPDFTADVMAAEALFRQLPGWTRRLRFPYLKEGDGADKRDGMRDWMALHDYRSGGVSISTSDWYYSERFAAWRKKHPKADAGKMRDAYLAHLWSRAQYYDGLARKVLGRSPAHVLLLHTNEINAAFLPEVIALFRERGWEIVAPEEAFEDPLYKQQIDTLPAGEGVVWAVARRAGRPGLRYPAEDGLYEKARLDRLGF
jgi:peptidoglycan/xylan/chitin deacetylase (PgdA/CDA1 family)